MAKDIKFNVQINVDGKESVVTTTTDIKTFAAEFAKAKSEVEKAGRSFANTADILITVQGAMAGMRKLTDELAGMSDAYNTQIEAETRLATVMRQRMDATDEDIQAMKDLASAQQQLGVVGDEVQLAALQQVATFATERGTLETLLPAMNNLLVQQKGMNATQSDAIAIANKAGKALMGQTGELREAGITFTAAQEQVMKFGTEQERAAMFAQVVMENVGNMNAELAKTDGGKAQQVANTIGDLKEQVGGLYTSMQPIISVSTSIGTAITSAMSIYQGLKATLLACTTTVKSLTASLNAMRLSFTKLAVTTGVGAAIAAISIILSQLADNAEDAESKLESLKSAENAFLSTAAQAKVDIEQQITGLKKLMEANADTTESVKTLNEKYGEAFGTHKTASEWYDTLIAKSHAYCMQLGYEAKAKELARQIADKQIAAGMNDKEMERMRNNGEQYEKKFRPYYDRSHNLTWGYLEYETDAYKQAKKDAEAYKNEIAELEKQMAIAQKGMEEYTSQLSATTPNNTTKKAKETTVTKARIEAMAPEGSLRQIEQRIATLKSQIEVSVNTTDRDAVLKELSELEARKRTVSIGVEADNNTLRQIEQRIATLKSQIEVSVNTTDRDAVLKELSELEARKRTVSIGVEADNNTLRQIEQRIATLKSQIAVSVNTTDRDAVLKELSELEARKRTVSIGVEADNNTLRQIEQRIATLKSQIAVSVSTTDRDAVLKELSELEARKRTVSIGVEADNNTLRQIEQRIATLKSQIAVSVSTTDRDAVLKELSELEDRRRNISIGVETDNNTLRQIEQRIATLKSQIAVSVSTTDRDTVLKELSELEDRRRNISIGVETDNNTLRQIEQRIATLKSQIEVSVNTTDRDAVLKELSELEARKRTVSIGVEADNNTLRQIEQRIATLKSQIAVSVSTTDRDAVLKELSELEARKRTVSIGVEADNNTLRQIEQRIATLKSQIAVSVSTTDRDAVLKELSELEDRRRNISIGVETDNNTLRQIEQRIATLKSQIAVSVSTTGRDTVLKELSELEDRRRNISIGVETDNNTLRQIEQRIATLKSQIAVSVSTTDRDAVLKELSELEEKRKAIEIELYAPEGSLKWVQEQISMLKSKFELEVNPESRARLVQEINRLENQRRFIELELNYKEPEEKPKAYNGVAVEMPDIAKTIPQIAKAGKNIEKMKKQSEAATGAVSELGSSMAGLGNAFELPALNIMGTIAQAIANMVMSYSKAMEIAAATTGPWGWISFAAAGLAQLTSVISSVKGMAAFADGGIVSGPTMALVGEYSGAANNPEVIAPLDRLRTLIQPVAAGGMEGTVEFHVKGNKLVGVLERAARQSGRS